jgi:separase
MDFGAIRAFLAASKGIGPDQIGEQALWFAKSVYNVAIEVLNRQTQTTTTCLAQQLFEISFLSLSILFGGVDKEDTRTRRGGEERGERWMKVKEGESKILPAGNSLSGLVLFGIKISEGMLLKCHQAESWAQAIKSMSDVLVDFPELISRVARGAQESSSHHLLKARGIRTTKVLMQALLEGQHGMGLGVCFLDEILLSRARPEDGILVEMLEVFRSQVQKYDDQKEAAECQGHHDLRYLTLLLQIVAVTKSLVRFGHHSENSEYARNCMSVVLGIQKTFEESRLVFEENLEHQQQIICRNFLAWTNCHLAAMAKHLNHLSPVLAEDVSHWSLFATESFVNWEEYLRGTSEYAEEEAEEPSSIPVREKKAIRAIASLCNEASYAGQTELLDRGDRLLGEWLSHQRCQERCKSSEPAHAYLGKVAYHSLAKAYSNYICPGEILDSIRDVSALPNDDDTNSDAMKGFIAIVEGSQDLMREEASAANLKLRSVNNGRLMRGVLQIMISAMHHQSGEYGVALAHAVEASRLMQGVIKSSLERSNNHEKCTADEAVVRNLHVLCLLYTGDLRCICGMPEEASRAYHEVLHQAGSDCNLFFVSVASLRMFKAYYMRCEWQKAQKHLDNAKETSERLQGGVCGSSFFSSKMVEIEVLLSYGCLSASTNDNKSALEHMQKALELSSTIEDSNGFSDRVIASQISQMEISAKLQMAEVHLLSEHREQASDILRSVSSSGHLEKHTDAGFKSRYLFISAILEILQWSSSPSDIGTMKSLLKFGEDANSARCHLDFEDRPEIGSDSDTKEGERILEMLLEAYRESRGIPVLSYKVAQLLSLLFSPADPFQASVFLHASIGISYHLQSTYIMRTGFLQGDFAKGRGSLSAKHKLAPDVFEALLSLDLADLREDVTQRSKIFGIIPQGVAVCSVSVVLPADILGLSNAPVLIFTRTLESQRSVSVKIPLRRDCRGAAKSCEGNGTTATFLHQLRTILSRSNASMKQDWDFSDKNQMKKWWTIRMKLDQELETLLKDVDRDILGPYAVFLLGEATSRRDLLLERVSESVCAATTAKLAQEVMEQLALILLHARRFDEKDICTQIKTVLLQSSSGPSSYEALFEAAELKALARSFKSVGEEELPPVSAFSPGSVLLVLDGQCQPFPWESLPRFQGQEFYRVPSLSYVHRAHQGRASSEFVDISTSVPSCEVEWENAYFLLNPSGDLTSTQKCFEKWFTEEQGWPGTSGKAPDSSELLKILSMKDIFLYFGHGTCEQYISKTMIETLQRCSAVFLMGCSSAKLSNNYMNQGRGFLLSYLLAGSPLAIGNLWDVTDKDIDRFAKSVLESCLMDEEGGVHSSSSEAAAYGGDDKRQTLTARRIMQARQACRLTTLTGSAPVYYGLPW